MADPRFYDNSGPFSLGEICAAVKVDVPSGVDASAIVVDIASLSGAGPEHLAFYAGGPGSAPNVASSQAGHCFVPAKPVRPFTPASGTVAIPCASVIHAFAAAARMFYPDSGLVAWSQQTTIDRTAEIGEDVVLGPGVVIGPGAEIGDRTRIGPTTVIGRGVAIGKDCEIASNVTVAHAYVGDSVLVLPGAQIGQPGFGFASSGSGHIKVPQLGRVIIQDRVEVGACTTIDRGALGDTVIGEGTKIDNLVQIGHNVHVGRHCVIIGQVGIAGSCELGDFVVLAGQVGLGDHAKVGSGARLASRAGTAAGVNLQGGRDYGGAPAKPVREWMREIYTLEKLAKAPKKTENG